MTGYNKMNSLARHIQLFAESGSDSMQSGIRFQNGNIFFSICAAINHPEVLQRERNTTPERVDTFIVKHTYTLCDDKMSTIRPENIKKKHDAENSERS